MEDRAAAAVAIKPRSQVLFGAPANTTIAAAFVAGFAALAWTTSWYATFKALHVLAAVVWVGGALMIQVLAFLILRAKDGAEMAAFARRAEWIGMRIFAPTSLALAALGFVLVHKGGWGYPFWVLFALVIWALSFLAGIGFLGPESGRIGKAIDQQGPDAQEVRFRIERILLFSRVELVLIALAVADMVLKPGT